MKACSFREVSLTSGFLFDKQELNRKTTIPAVYDRFLETGRIDAFRCDYDPNDPNAVRPHIYWDSDVAKWIEAASYIIQKHPDPELEARVDALVEQIKKNQLEDGYFNLYFITCEQQNRFTKRDCHELYCAGHLMEAAVAYAKATGKTDLLICMEKYADLIRRVFMEEKSAGFCTPGHEEIELALIKMYLHTGKKKFLELASFFIDTRGCVEEDENDAQIQAHRPVREQDTAQGHSVRAMYLYTAMAMLAAQTGDATLISACRKLWEDTVLRKMYVTGGIGSTHIGESFTVPFDLCNDQAYTETCAGIGLIFFSHAMLALEHHARYADTIERVLYNGLLSGLSLDGKAFFYENPLEINQGEYFHNRFGRRRFPFAQRQECFSCSCCPPNVNRLLASLGDYAYGIDSDTLFVHQFVSSRLQADGMVCEQTTSYPNDGEVSLKAQGAARVAIRIPGWCESFRINKPYDMVNGYAVVVNDGERITVSFDMTPRAVFGDPRIRHDAGRVCVMRGPVVYCAEGIDNPAELYTYVLPAHVEAEEHLSDAFGLYTLDIPCQRRLGFEGELYRSCPPKTVPDVLHMIPYSCFANRGKTDMAVWFCSSYH